MSNVLEVKNIEKYYGNKSNLTKAIAGISFNVEKGEFIGIMGASGSGKTTLLNCISTIDRVTAGKIIINNQDITKLKGNKLNKFRREELGFIFQDSNLLDTLTAYENIALALTIQKVNPHEIDKRVKEVAEKLEISDILNKYLYQISGGQKQRVASSRAIITNPKMVLADEPTGALDSKSARQLLETLATIIIFIAIYLGVIFLIASSAILALKQLTESSDNKQRYTILRKIGCDEKIINQALFRQIFIFFMLPLGLAIIHSIFGIKFILSMMAALASPDELLPSVIATAVIIGIIYGLYFLATYIGSKNIIKEDD